MKMRKIDKFNINVPEDVESFFRYIYGDLNILIHPDDDFSEVIDIHTEEPFFTKDEVKVLNSYMDRCFRICTFYRKDIYEIAINIDKEIYGKY